ncbi:peroxidase family protein [Ancylobacter sp.]|uniref:peroxidase family protein n=1 Tax=Ancylobacter sp. TaxID=1872567 RepID=UPI003D0AE4AB
MAHHGVKDTYEVEGEIQVVKGTELETPGAGFRFGRIFEGLAPFRPTDASLTALGARMTAALAAGQPPLPPDDSKLPAGYTYFGQFVDHDITRDGTAGRVEEVKPLSPDQVLQIRSPRLDLDSLYGDFGGRADAFFEPADPVMFRIGLTEPVPQFAVDENDPAGKALPNDLPRILFGQDAGKPLIGDDRNDENLIVAQLHLAFLKFHNKVAETLKAKGAISPTSLFKQTRELVTRHYQWLVLFDFIRRIADPATFAAVLGLTPSDLPDDPAKPLTLPATLRLNPLFFRVTGYETPPMPLEFSVATYRLGHSLVRPGYSWNRIFPGAPFRQFFDFTNTSGGLGKPDKLATAPANDFVALPSIWIADWRRLFDFSEVPGFPAVPRPQVPLGVAKKLDTRIMPALGNLPGGGGNLAARNLLRGARLGLPCGQDVAQLMAAAGGLSGSALLTPGKVMKTLIADDALALDDNAVLREHEFDVKTPLWYYILREAELAGGEHLGPVGSRILIETFVGLIRASVTSIFNAGVDPADLGDTAMAGTLKVFSPDGDSPLRVGEAPITSLAHLLAFVDDVNPLGDPVPAPAAED